MEWIYEPWPWYVSGAAIALVMLVLLLVGKNFGMSSNLRTLCTMCGADRSSEFFRFDWAAQKWNLLVMLGAVIGGFIAANFLTADAAVQINPDTVAELQSLGFESAGGAYLPDELYSMEQFTNPKSLILLALGGLMVGFGARYAGGCTSGHAISGLSNLQWPSLLAVIGFFAGGMLMIYFLFPLIF
ncbi:YeeE/YedE family protein [Robiginitalea sp. SC105]|uniref:YeeE/YedE family protein n=1 Tax=Robiginitalea sp. SC105 TaxID=2762332 RepID=UPI001639567D|nr:YeeE/YedE thiosulfate transporter family protein [Robiginitalea sp. SC105]MBC2838111.1 YeeE/YedE family protein [Robiginitalea sp. SC105]